MVIYPVLWVQLILILLSFNFRIQYITSIFMHMFKNNIYFLIAGFFKCTTFLLIFHLIEVWIIEDILKCTCKMIAVGLLLLSAFKVFFFVDDIWKFQWAVFRVWVLFLSLTKFCKILFPQLENSHLLSVLMLNSQELCLHRVPFLNSSSSPFPGL